MAFLVRAGGFPGRESGYEPSAVDRQPLREGTSATWGRSALARVQGPLETPSEYDAGLSVSGSLGNLCKSLVRHPDLELK